MPWPYGKMNSPGLTESQFPQELQIHAASINKYTFPMSELFFARSPPSQPCLPLCGTYFFWPQTIQKCTPSNRPAGPLSNGLDYMVRGAGHWGHNEHGESWEGSAKHGQNWEGRGRCHKIQEKPTRHHPNIKTTTTKQFPTKKIQPGLSRRGLNQFGKISDFGKFSRIFVRAF